MPEDDGIGTWITLLKWTSDPVDEVKEREQAIDEYHGIRDKVGIARIQTAQGVLRLGEAYLAY